MAEAKSGSAPESPARTPPPSADLVIGDYMERLGTRLGVLETELRYAWRALDLLSQEYIKMWERLEKLELLLSEQQSVISQLIEFYSTVEPNETELDLLGRPRIIQGITSVDQIGLLNNDMAISSSATQFINELKMDVGADGISLPNESFYRSLNNAYRNDLVCPSTSGATAGASQLGMIWEESEEDSNGTTKREESKDLISATGEPQEIFCSLSYHEFRGNSLGISEDDLLPLSELSSVDQVALEKLKELDRLTTKLQKDSQSLKELQDRLLADSPKHHKYSKDTTDVSEIVVREDKTDDIDDQLRRMCAETELENWGFSTTTKAISDMLMLTCDQAAATPLLSIEEPTRETSLQGFISNPTSPRRFVTSPNIMYSSTSRLTTNSPLNDIGSSRRSLPLSPKPERVDKTSYRGELSIVNSDLFSTGLQNEAIGYSLSSERISSPTPSLIRTRQDGYIDKDMLREDQVIEGPIQQSSSPPPPAPRDTSIHLMPCDNIDSIIRKSPVSIFAAQGASCDSHGRLSPRAPRSPKSPRSSPKHAILKSSSSNTVAAKSDSGLSSMSGGWSSLEKSPEGLNSKGPTSYASENLVHINRISKHHSLNPPAYSSTSASAPTAYSEYSDFSYNEIRNDDFNHLLPGGLRTSAFTTVLTPTSLPGDGFSSNSDSSNFVPPPAPETGSSSKRRSRYDYNAPPEQADLIYYNDQPAIYSVAGSNRQDFTSVYTSGAANYFPSTTVSSYPDLIGPHASQEQFSCASSSNYRPTHAHEHRSHSASTYLVSSSNTPKRSLNRVYSTGSVPTRVGVSHMDEYKTAVYRTMFPTGNITDALTYYPTSNTFDGQLHRPDYNAWIPNQHSRMVRDPTSSTIRSGSSVDTYDARSYDPRYCQGAPTAHCRRDIAFSEMDLRNKGVSDLQDQSRDMAYYEPSSVIVSQSGYLSIASDIKDVQDDKSKKSKKGGLKSAMSSVSNWLPDIHLSKRHRSYSLPTGVRREDLGLTKETGKLHVTQSLRSKQPPSSRKKKKIHLVSTMSGLLLKAKNRTQRFQQSMSDPEHSEAEWSGRQSVVSEDSEPDTVFSDTQERPPPFLRVSTEPNSFSNNSNQILSQRLQNYSETSTIEADERYKPDLQRDHRVLDQRMDSKIEHRSDQIFDTGQQKIADQSLDSNLDDSLDQIIDSREHLRPNQLPEQRVGDQSTDFQDQKPNSRSDKVSKTVTVFDDDDPFGASSLFATVGEVKKVSSKPSNEDETENGMQLPPVTLGSASREFAVSRALGKYRRRQSSSQLDETPTTEDTPQLKTRDEIFTVITTDEEEEELRRNEIFERISSEENNKLVHAEGQALVDESTNIPKPNRHYPPPRHQASLEIPWGGRGSGDTDDDNRSTHSWRSTSRVSSRRQSTEDSIDSEDEWYCYELRKLEELERQSKFEAEIQRRILPEDYEPEHDVKERMSFVLKELRTKVTRNDEREDIPGSRRGSRESRRGSYETARKSSYEGIDDRPGEKFNRDDRRESYERIGMEPRRLSQELNETDFKISSAEERRGSFKNKERQGNHESRQYYEHYGEELRINERSKKFDKVKRRDDQPKSSTKREKGEEKSDASSGDTSGPDSPQHSTEEYDGADEAKAVAAELEMMRRCSITSEPKQNERHTVFGSGSISREGSLSVAPSEMSVSIQEGWGSEETATVREGSLSVPGSEVSSDHPGTPSLPRFKPEGDPAIAVKEEPSGKDGGPAGSKWKLLKTLKEKKAELKSQEAAAAAAQAETPGSTAVSTICH